MCPWDTNAPITYKQGIDIHMIQLMMLTCSAKVKQSFLIIFTVQVIAEGEKSLSLVFIRQQVL